MKWNSIQFQSHAVKILRRFISEFETHHHIHPKSNSTATAEAAAVAGKLSARAAAFAAPKVSPIQSHTHQQQASKHQSHCAPYPLCVSESTLCAVRKSKTHTFPRPVRTHLPGKSVVVVVVVVIIRVLRIHRNPKGNDLLVCFDVTYFYTAVIAGAASTLRRYHRSRYRAAIVIAAATAANVRRNSTMSLRRISLFYVFQWTLRVRPPPNGYFSFPGSLAGKHCCLVASLLACSLAIVCFYRYLFVQQLAREALLISSSGTTATSGG